MATEKRIDPPERLNANTRRIVLLLLDLLREAREPYESYADLKEDLKLRCVKYRLAYDATMITAALDRVEHGGRFSVITPRTQRGRR